MSMHYESSYAKHSFDPQTGIIFSDWFTATEKMSASEFRDEMENWLSFCQKVKAAKMFDHCVNFIYPINPEEQVWMARLLKKGWVEAGLRQYAHIVPEEFIANLSVEQMFAEFDLIPTEPELQIRHFSSHSEALNWLNRN